MPKSISAEKAARTAERKRLRNRSRKSATKTHLTRAEKLIAANQLEQAQQAVMDTISALDRDAKKGVIHPNTAARRKSRLMKQFNQAKLPGSAQRKTDKA
ncbi:MAG: 30S ribosomal protein S20 [Dehalococcoidia bacterium]|nr:30S ribosomal protein S20 [Dehalococcoidia bacterium]